MITVVGEALVDLVVMTDGSVEAAIGGAPFNTARACGRLGAEVRFVGAISVDRFGTLMAAQLEADGVSTDAVVRVEVPTTLAAAELDAEGVATYRFYTERTSAPALERVDVVETDVLFTGGLGLLLEPMAAAVERAVTDGDDRMVMIDVNCRPKIVPDRAQYVARLDRLLPRASIVKVSDEDLDYLRPGVDHVAAARGMLTEGTSAVLLTRGGDGVQVLVGDGEAVVPVQPADVVDTIGAGDSFSGGFLSWWAASGFGVAEASELDAVVAAVQAANAVAGVVVTRRGADPPWRHELPADWSP